jgi:hypothetical protein
LKSISFSTEMVRAILDGRKTQTRRPIEPQPSWGKVITEQEALSRALSGFDPYGFRINTPTQSEAVTNAPYKPGDIIYVRGTWAMVIFLRVVDVRAERLWGITEEGAQAEGVKAYGRNNCSGTSARIAFAELWDSIYEGKGYGWQSNPWVWVTTFERVDYLTVSDVSLLRLQ